MSKASENANIDIFLRVKPVPRPSDKLFIDNNENKLEFVIPRSLAQGFVNNQREHYEFRFNGILGHEAKQDEVFERVARPVVAGALEGFNGTIFAYGQTGSGKTFTMTGGPERYVDRGIIPRSISAIFADIAKRSDSQFSVKISYLEIYNETGYDLLDPDREIMALEDMPKVHVMEDEEQQISYRNLGLHLANNEEEALNLLFLGDTNRVIGATKMNQSSSRSHCIFTVYVEARKHGEDVVRRSKLNLVDLAGSERVSKTGADGDTLKQAKYINLSLHYLEQVIIALQERAMGLSRPHIPYRNSMMTTALKDSLGGNCRTTMIATISSEQEQLDESISTCRFAVRVAMVRNQVSLNEEVDPTLIIRRLKAEIRDLKEEVRLLRGEEEVRGPLTPDEVVRLQKQIEAYCADSSPDASLNFGGSMMFIRAAFEVFKGLVKAGGGTSSSLGGKGGENGVRSSLGAAGNDVASDSVDQIKKLKMQVQQRDNEINILVSMLQRREAGAGGKGGGGGPALQAAAAPLLRNTVENISIGQSASPAETSRALVDAGRQGMGVSSSVSSSVDDIAALMNTNLLGDRNKAFELFRKSYRQNEVIEENKLLLKQKYDSAKSVGQAVNDSKQRITELKALIEQRRVQRAMSGNEDQEDPEEDRCKELIEKEKKRYKDAFNQLRDLKKEIEHLHLLLEQSRTRLQKDFEQWMALMTRQQQQQQQPQSGMTAVPAGPLGSPSPLMSRSPAAAGPAPPNLPPARPRQAWGDAESDKSFSVTPSLASPAVAKSGSFISGGAKNVDPRVLELARPYLTGNADADEDIIKFYEAKAKLMAQLK